MLVQCHPWCPQPFLTHFHLLKVSGQRKPCPVENQQEQIFKKILIELKARHAKTHARSFQQFPDLPVWASSGAMSCESQSLTLPKMRVGKYSSHRGRTCWQQGNGSGAYWDLRLLLVRQAKAGGTTPINHRLWFPLRESATFWRYVHDAFPTKQDSRWSAPLESSGPQVCELLKGPLQEPKAPCAARHQLIPGLGGIWPSSSWGSIGEVLLSCVATCSGSRSCPVEQLWCCLGPTSAIGCRSPRCSRPLNLCG